MNFISQKKPFRQPRKELID